MSQTSSASLLVVCQQKDFAVSRVSSCLQDAKDEVPTIIQKLHSLSSQKVPENPGNLAQNDPDLITVTTEESTIGIDQIREFQKMISTKPTARQTKIVLFPESEKLTAEAQNALLKTLEEPPDDTAIILIASDAVLLLPTVVSRCQIINLSAPTEDFSESSHQSLSETLALIKSADIVDGFAWAKTVGPKRVDVLGEIDKLLRVAQKELQSGKINPTVIRKLLRTKKYLSANTNVRLTLENLFLD